MSERWLRALGIATLILGLLWIATGVAGRQPSALLTVAVGVLLLVQGIVVFANDEFASDWGYRVFGPRLRRANRELDEVARERVAAVRALGMGATWKRPHDHYRTGLDSGRRRLSRGRPAPVTLPSSLRPHAERRPIGTSTGPSTAGMVNQARLRMAELNVALRSRRDRNWRALARAAAVALLLAGCRDAKQYEAALDSLSVPPSWQVVKTVTQPSTDMCVNCPQVHRYYVADGELTDLLEQVKSAVANAGFTSMQVGSPGCDLNDNTGLACTVTATKDRTRLLAVIYRPGSDVDSLGLAVPGKSTIRITLTNT